MERARGHGGEEERMKSLPSIKAGRYKVSPKESSMAAAMNGHLFAHTEGVTAESDGERVTFFHKGKEVFSCNSVYAAFNFCFEEDQP